MGVIVRTRSRGNREDGLEDYRARRRDAPQHLRGSFASSPTIHMLMIWTALFQIAFIPSERRQPHRNAALYWQHRIGIEPGRSASSMSRADRRLRQIFENEGVKVAIDGPCASAIVPKICACVPRGDAARCAPASISAFDIRVVALQYGPFLSELSGQRLLTSRCIS